MAVLGPEKPLLLGYELLVGEVPGRALVGELPELLGDRRPDGRPGRPGGDDVQQNKR